MSLTSKESLEEVAKAYKNYADILQHNENLYDIYEGDLQTQILADLKNQLSEEAFKAIQGRIAPVNVLKRVIDKLSKIYSTPPVRKLWAGNKEAAPKDKELWTWYEEQFDINTNLQLGNEYFNLYKNNALEPYLDRGVPRLRVLTSNRFFVMSDDFINPLRPTRFVKIMGTIKVKDTERTLLFVYSDDEFVAQDSEGEIVQEIMARPDIAAVGGKNPFGRIPFVYLNRSKNELMPKRDSDTLAMTKLIPILLSDLNFAVMFQAFSIIYGINVDEEGLKKSPNAFWRFKSDPANPQAKPEVGVIKPEVDIDQVVNFIIAQLALWLESRNIKPGAVGEMTIRQAASGVAKVIDESDTSEDRRKQIPYFMQAEAELADLVINTMHPVWMRNAEFEKKSVAFSKGLKLKTEFPEQLPILDKSVVIDDQIKLLDNGLQDEMSALREIYPDLNEEQLKEKQAQIAKEWQKRMEIKNAKAADNQAPGASNDSNGSADPQQSNQDMPKDMGDGAPMPKDMQGSMGGQQ